MKPEDITTLAASWGIAITAVVGVSGALIAGFFTLAIAFNKQKAEFRKSIADLGEKTSVNAALIDEHRGAIRANAAMIGNIALATPAVSVIVPTPLPVDVVSIPQNGNN